MSRKSIKRLTDIPNVGQAMERDFLLPGIEYPADLDGQDPYQFCEALCSVMQKKHDSCVLVEVSSDGWIVALVDAKLFVGDELLTR